MMPPPLTVAGSDCSSSDALFHFQNFTSFSFRVLKFSGLLIVRSLRCLSSFQHLKSDYSLRIYQHQTLFRHVQHAVAYLVNKYNSTVLCYAFFTTAIIISHTRIHNVLIYIKSFWHCFPRSDC